MNKNIEEIKFLTPFYERIVTVVPFMKTYYLKKGYHMYSNFFLSKIFYKLSTAYLRKIKILIIFFFSCSFIFKRPKKKDVLIYDSENLSLEKTMKGFNYGIVNVRVNKFKQLYITKKIILEIVNNFFVRSIKQNYIAALIKEIDPKVVITNIDNSADFYITCKILNKTKTKFIAVQNGNRFDIIHGSKKNNKAVFIPEFICFSEFDKKIYERKKCNVKNFYPVGSLRASLALEYFKNKKNKIVSNKYDICLVSEQLPFTNTDLPHVKNFQAIAGKVAEYTHRISKEENLSLIFTGRQRINDPNADEEKYFYKHFLGNYNFKIHQGKNDSFSSYRHIAESKLVIGFCSTILREAFLFKKKVLACNFTGHKDIVFPDNGISSFTNDTTYASFKKRVLAILSMSNKNYIKKLIKKPNFIISNKVNTAFFIRNKIKGILE